MISRPDRLDALRRAVDDFSNQTHTQRELVIVVDDDDYASQVNHLLQNKDGIIYLVTVSPKRPLGALRNIALKSCHGEFVCQWDDDDRYSPERLALQIDGLCSVRADACFLYQQLHFFQDTREMFWTDWRYRQGRCVTAALSRIIPGTVLCKRDVAIYPEKGDLAIKGEDSVYATQLLRSGAIGIETPPGTYLRIYHGSNTWDRRHHREIAVWRSRPAAVIHAWRSMIEESISSFRISSPVKVMAGNRVAFEF
jgi:glycosyltransferase involved in cell wall biosynthesis